MPLIPQPGVALVGPLAGLMGTAEVQNLQRALANLAIATQRPAISPGAYATGVVDDATMTAVVAALGVMSDQLPSSVYLPLQAALAIGSSTATAKNFVSSYATQLTVAANTAAAKYRVAPVGPLPFQMPSFLSQLFAPGWYRTPFGMILIGAVGYIAYKKLGNKKGSSTSTTTTTTTRAA